MLEEAFHEMDKNGDGRLDAGCERPARQPFGRGAVQPPHAVIPYPRRPRQTPSLPPVKTRRSRNGLRRHADPRRLPCREVAAGLVEIGILATVQQAQVYV